MIKKRKINFWDTVTTPRFNEQQKVQSQNIVQSPNQCVGEEFTIASNNVCVVTECNAEKPTKRTRLLETAVKTSSGDPTGISNNKWN